MPRPPRAFLPGLPQHLIQRGNNRTAIFAADADYTFYLDCLHTASLQHGVTIHAYVLMTNHVHLLVTPLYTDSLPRVMQCLGRRYVRYFNTKYQRTGTLWEGRFKACLIDTDRYLLACSRYIELNPVRAKMVRHPEEYRWSSYRAHAMGESNPLLTKHAVYLALGATDETRQIAYSQLHEGSLAETTLQQIRIATNKGWVLGSESLKQAAEAHTGRSLWPRPRGRPKKLMAHRF
jgi:putative transposase